MRCLVRCSGRGCCDGDWPRCKVSQGVAFDRNFRKEQQGWVSDVAFPDTHLRRESCCPNFFHDPRESAVALADLLADARRVRLVCQGQFRLSGTKLRLPNAEIGRGLTVQSLAFIPPWISVKIHGQAKHCTLPGCSKAGRRSLVRFDVSSQFAPLGLGFLQSRCNRACPYCELTHRSDWN